jgi:excisionase family DNA binding protein
MASLIDPTEPTLTVMELADRYSVHPETIRDLIKSGQVRAYRVGRQFRIPESEWQSYIESTANVPK